MALFLWLLLCAFIGYCGDRNGWNMWAGGTAFFYQRFDIVSVLGEDAL